MWNADELESALARKHEVLAKVEDEEQRSRREEAIDQMLRYVALLRDAATGEPTSGRMPTNRPFAFKLELEDGRWDIEEKSLTIAPRVGDVLSFEDGRQWRVRASQLVRPRPSHKPAREFFVCAPAA